MAVSETSVLRFVWTLILIVLLVPCRARPSPTPASEEQFSEGLGARDMSLPNRGDDGELRALLGRFLYTLNFTEQEPKPRTLAGLVEPPEYMMELYERYAKDRSAGPAANIARSFKNEDSSPYRTARRGVRTTSLTFNVSVPHHERVVAAELRLYVLVRRDPQHADGVDWKVTVFVRQAEGGPLLRRSEGGSGDNDSTSTQELAVRHGYLVENRWEAFDLTDAVLRWRDPENASRRLQLLVKSECKSELQDKDDSDIFIDLDIEKGMGGKHEPVLIVFSDDESDKDRSDKTIPEDFTDIAGKDDGGPERNGGLSPRTRRNAKGNQCKRTALYVDFKEIGWDSWIVAPPGFEAYTCHGECEYPLLPQATPTKHAIIQTLLNLKSPLKVSQPCCVPTKLEPISLLYENENGHVIFQHKYEGMVVAECGCR